MISDLVLLSMLVPFALTVALVRRYPPSGLVLAGLTMVPLWEASKLPPITVADLNIYTSDVVTLVLLTVGVLEFNQLRANLRGWIVPWLVFGALLAFSMLRGFMAFGLPGTINESRTMWWFYAALTWVLSTRPERLKLRTASLVIGWALVLVACYHAALYGVGGASSRVYLEDGTNKPGRFLVASQSLALLLCAATVFLGHSAPRRARQSVVSSLVFIGTVFLAQSRSVWGAAALGAVAVMVGSQQKKVRIRGFILLVTGSLMAIIGWYAGILESFGSGQLVDSASNDTTWEWRTTSWKNLISQAIDRGPATIIVGNPYGSGFLRKDPFGRWIDITPHNWYVEIILRLGIIGLIALFAILIPAIIKSRKQFWGWTFTLVAVAIYGISYSVEWFVAPWLGVAITMSLRSDPGQGHAGPAPPNQGRIKPGISQIHDRRHDGPVRSSAARNEAFESGHR